MADISMRAIFFLRNLYFSLQMSGDVSQGRYMVDGRNAALFIDNEVLSQGCKYT